jgi:hypothetical protein
MTHQRKDQTPSAFARECRPSTSSPEQHGPFLYLHAPPRPGDTGDANRVRVFVANINMPSGSVWFPWFGEFDVWGGASEGRRLL